jgi:3',5'-cyclic AMP phosphodiesterase CpdA
MQARLLHLSDIHFGGENRGALAAATDYLLANPVDLIVVSGDLTLGGAPEEFATAAAWLSKLPKRRLVLPGNHDTPLIDLSERFVDPFGRFERTIGHFDDLTFRSSSLVARGFNSARGWQMRLNWSKGAVSRAQVDRTVRVLQSSPQAVLRVAACHHPLLEAHGGPMTGRVHGGPAAARRLTLAGADIVLTGHLHAPFVEPMPFGDGCTYAIGAGTLSMRERGAPPGFNLLEVTNDQLAVTAIGWTTAGLSAQKVWKMALRARPVTRGP